MTPVLMRGYDVARSFWNPNETILNQANVKAKGIKLAWVQALEGDSRGSESTPLIVPSVTMQDGIKRDIVIVSALNGLTWAFDANDSDILWVSKLGVPIKSSQSIDYWLVNDWWSTLSTGIVDADTGRWYGVTWASPDGSPQKAKHGIYCLEISNGQSCGRTDISNLSYTPPGPSTPIMFGSQMRKQRSALLLLTINSHKILLFAAGSVLETSKGAAGWVVADDLTSGEIIGLPLTTKGFGAGVWMAGGGILADSKNNLYLVSGNGSFNGTSDLSESVIKLQYTLRSGNVSPPILKVVDHWTPYSDAGRVGQDPSQLEPDEVQPNKVAGVSLPSMKHGEMPVNGMHMPRATSYSGWSDEDLGSAPPILLEKYNEIIAAGKDSVAYFVKLASMGGTMPADLEKPAGNYAKLIHAPIWFGTYDPSSPQPAVITALDFMPGGKTHHMHSASVVYDSPVNGTTIFCGAENSPVRMWQVQQDGSLKYMAASADIASPQVPNGGMTGSWLTVSSNGQTQGTGLLWAMFPYFDANKQVKGGHLVIYDGDHFTGTAGNGTLIKLWDSSVNAAIPIMFNKFMQGTETGGKFFYPSYDGKLMVFGLNQ